MYKRRASGYNRKTTYRRKPYARRRYDSRVKRIVRQVVPPPEPKYIDTGNSGGTLATTSGTVIPLSYIAVGYANDELRVGFRMDYRVLYGKWSFVPLISANWSQIRLVIFMDKSSAGAVPASTDYFELPATNGVLSQRNTINKKRFKMLYDTGVINFNIANINAIKTISYFVKFKRPCVAQYLDGTATAASLGQNMVYALVISNTSGVTQPTYFHTNRLVAADN